jgi:oligoribonuclease NrnB/cAMP/cGMP phosphodiesterase (DHH superfamily)
VEKVFCYYHSKDLDGRFSGAVVKKKYPNAEFFGFDYGDKIDLVEGYDIVYIVDISMPLAKMMVLKQMNKRVIWIDHHARTIEQVEKSIELEGIRDKNNEHSACVLTWIYLYPKKVCPLILLHIEDLDLWKFKYPKTNALYLGIDTSYPYPFGLDNLVKFLYHDYYSENVENLIRVGETIDKHQKTQILRTVMIGKVIPWKEYKIAIINTNLNKSKVGNDALKEFPDCNFALIWHLTKDKVNVSLRSRGDTDVAKVAEKFGGGGHKPASGFVIDFHKFYDEFLKEE